MATTLQSDGSVIDYANTGAAISSGAAVKIGGTSTSAMLGVALTDIAATTGNGAVAIEGVFDIPKVSAAVIAKGERVLWDASAAAVDDDAATPATGDFFCGTAWEAAGNGVTTIAVKLYGYAVDAT